MYRLFGYMHSRIHLLGEAVKQRSRDQLGQGTVEYVALILVVALVMVGVVAALKSFQTSEGNELGETIIKKIKEAVNKVKY